MYGHDRWMLSAAFQKRYATDRKDRLVDMARHNPDVEMRQLAKEALHREYAQNAVPADLR